MWCVCVYIEGVCVFYSSFLWRQEGGVDIGPRLRGGSEPSSHECWEQNLGYLLEKYMLLTSKRISVAPSVQILIYFRWFSQIYFLHNIILLTEIIYFWFDSRNLYVSMGPERKRYIEWQIFIQICLYIFACLVT